MCERFIHPLPADIGGPLAPGMPDLAADLGIGKAMFEWAINRAKERNAHLLQLTTDKKRPDAIKFYEDLGFKATHEGMKMHFD